MPGGPLFDSTQSYIAFAVVKFIGYSAVTNYFNHRHSDTYANPLLFGLTRTLLGMSLGAIVGLAGLVQMELALVVFLSGLIPFRIFEWYLTLRFFYRRSVEFRENLAVNIIVGVFWSFILDIPAIIGFIATGGFWIC